MAQRFWRKFYLFSLSLLHPQPSEKGQVPSFEENECPYDLRMLCQNKVWLKLAKWFYRRRLLKVVNVFSLSPYFPLNLNKLESDMLYWTSFIGPACVWQTKNSSIHLQNHGYNLWTEVSITCSSHLQVLVDVPIRQKTFRREVNQQSTKSLLFFTIF